MIDLIENHFAGVDLDVRKQRIGFSRFMDQKVTPDVLSFVSKSIKEYVSAHADFTAPDIEKSNYFVNNMQHRFNKPKPGSRDTSREYDKWSAQVIQTLRFARVIEECGKRKNTHFYRVKMPAVIEFVAKGELQSYRFLVSYLTKLLKDSGFYNEFETYRDEYINGTLDSTDFQMLKTAFVNFMHAHTNIRKDYEPKRIFPKVLNILATEHRVPGAVSGRKSAFPFVSSDLLYNRTNFRDKNKSKYISRQGSRLRSKEVTKLKNLNYRIDKAKKHIRELHSESEVKDQLAIGPATQVHHIFPAHEFPQFADRPENLIRLTASQHNSRAHPNNNTRIIDRQYQLVCLQAKLQNIKESLELGKFGYSKESFVAIVNTCLALKIPYDATFESIRKILEKHYTS